MRDFTDNLIAVSDALNFMNDSMRGIKFRIEGEVSSLNASSKYKAVYFSIKDDHSVLNCIMWKDKYRSSDIDLEVGQQVELTGEFSIYPAKGTFSFSVDEIKLAGLGDIIAQLEALKKKLFEEGLMDESRKREIPALPMRIGLVTSGAGAAVHDVIRTIKRRSSFMTIVFAGVNVEGKGSVESIISGLDAIQGCDVDVILLVRGGGSFEDLLVFSDERVARAVAASKIPVVTGIGHEPDVSICDLVSDLSCSTPTAAAEIISAKSYELSSQIETFSQQLLNFGEDFIYGTNRLIDDYKDRLESVNPVNLLETYKASLRYSTQSLLRIGNALEDKYVFQLTSRINSLNALSPTNVMKRGFSYVQLENGKIVKSVCDVAVDDDIQINFADGSTNCKVLEIFD